MIVVAVVTFATENDEVFVGVVEKKYTEGVRSQKPRRCWIEWNEKLISSIPHVAPSVNRKSSLFADLYSGMLRGQSASYERGERHRERYASCAIFRPVFIGLFVFFGRHMGR